MTDSVGFVIGSAVECRDGTCGVLQRLVVDPGPLALTHLVVEPPHVADRGHLVPIDLVDAVGRTVSLRCSLAQFGLLENAEGVDAGEDQPTSWPYYGREPGGMIQGTVGGSADGPAGARHRLPPGEVELEGGDPVHATDGGVGRVHGLVVGTGDHRITHVLVSTGHLWDRRTSALPVASVTEVGGGIRLSLSREQVRGVRSVDGVAGSEAGWVE